MPGIKHALEKGGEKKLELNWKGFYKNLTVKYEGQEIGSFVSKNDLTTPQDLSLPDGTTLTIQYKKQRIHLSRNGKPLPGTEGDPDTAIKLATGVIFFLGGLNVILGIWAELDKVDFLQNMGVGYFSAAYGAALLFFGYMTGRKHVWALILAIALVILDTALGFVYMADQMQPGQTPSFTSIGLRVIFIIPMWKAVGPMRQLAREQAKASHDVIDN